MKKDFHTLFNKWAIPDDWRKTILEFSCQDDFCQKISFWLGSSKDISENTIFEAFNIFHILIDEPDVVFERTHPQKRYILINNFRGSLENDIVAQTHHYFKRTLVEGAADIVYPYWGDTVFDLLQLMLAMLTPDGKLSEKLPRHNRWPLRGAYTQKIKNICSALSTLSCNVMITGPSGIGKEAIARLIHSQSKVSGKFLSLSVSTIPKELFAGILFGYEKGVYTGAEKDHLGYFELAQNGTLFLDEIADIEPKHQAALLRVLSERQGSSIGGTRTYPISCRIISATNKPIRKDSEFRPDLRIRLAEQELSCAKNINDWHPLTPLSLVPEQIPLLFAMQYVRCFHEQIGYSTTVKDVVISDADEKCSEDEVFRKLMFNAWKMNFRELAYVSLHSLLRFLVFHNTSIISMQELTLKILVKTESKGDFFDSIDQSTSTIDFDLLFHQVPANTKKWDFLSDYIHQKAIEYLRERYRYNDTMCADYLDIDKSSLSRFLKKR